VTPLLRRRRRLGCVHAGCGRLDGGPV